MADRIVVPAERIEKAILLIRGHKVMLDRDLAELYGVETRSLVQAVKRNIDRFPADFMFQLTPDEGETLRSQIVISLVFEAIRQLMAPPSPAQKNQRIGFRPD